VKLSVIFVLAFKAALTFVPTATAAASPSANATEITSSASNKADVIVIVASPAPDAVPAVVSVEVAFY